MVIGHYREWKKSNPKEQYYPLIHCPLLKKMNPETPFEKFRQFTKKIVSVPKAEIDRRETPSESLHQRL
jgi:hypothetical protein